MQFSFHKKEKKKNKKTTKNILKYQKYFSHVINFRNMRFYIHKYKELTWFEIIIFNKKKKIQILKLMHCFKHFPISYFTDR